MKLFKNIYEYFLPPDNENDTIREIIDGIQEIDRNLNEEDDIYHDNSDDDYEDDDDEEYDEGVQDKNKSKNNNNIQKRGSYIVDHNDSDRNSDTDESGDFGGPPSEMRYYDNVHQSVEYNNNNLLKNTPENVNLNISEEFPNKVSFANDNEKPVKRIQYKKLSYNAVEKGIDKYYHSINHQMSSALDILATYLKGQKIIYMEAKHYCEEQLNKLMMPAIILSTTATVCSGVPYYTHYRSIVIAGLNAMIAFLISLVNYYKLDAASEAHKTSSHQYDKLQTSVEFTSGSVLLFKNTDPDTPENIIDENKYTSIDMKKELRNKLDNVEKKIS